MNKPMLGAQVFAYIALVLLFLLILISESVAWPRLDWSTATSYATNSASVAQVIMAVLATATLIVLWSQFATEAARQKRAQIEDLRSIDVRAGRETLTLSGGMVDFIRLGLAYGGERGIRPISASCDDPAVELIFGPTRDLTLGPRSESRSCSWVFKRSIEGNREALKLSFLCTWEDLVGAQQSIRREVVLG